MGDNSGEFGRWTLSFAWILTALGALLLCLFLVYTRQGAQSTPEEVSEAAAQPAIAPAPSPVQEPAEEKAQAEASATQIIAEVKRFQDATESGMEFSEYDKRLNALKSELNDTLPAFVRHDTNGDVFRQEVAAALRDYTAAANWWKTTIRDSSVFTEIDRKERTDRIWASARTHLTNAQNALAH